MSISSVVFLLPFMLILAFGDQPEKNEANNSPTWTDYTPQWCTKDGRVRLSVKMPKPEGCQKLCVEMNPKCTAVEWWENAGGLCYECTKPSLRVPYKDPSDLAHPPHVYIMKPMQGKV
ncbi:hypothetical protein OS493_007869 [Desmophyllum pertusum]|uniref:Uncharacterized protein n=1 Tax=Desmophyllum pertusum TaxID=174260 RepID=A0A9X0CLQ4_9CNID|nr:hypothetical protein OS493_007869 [Desmophyllum pertusum]